MPWLVWTLRDPGFGDIDDIGVYTGYPCKALGYTVEVTIMIPRIVAKSLEGLCYVLVS